MCQPFYEVESLSSEAIILYDTLMNADHAHKIECYWKAKRAFTVRYKDITPEAMSMQVSKEASRQTPGL